MIICLSLLFGMNKLIGYLTIDKLYKMEISRYQELLKQYRKQANVRHDLKNHFISLSALAEHEEWDKLKEYLLKLCNAGMIGEEDIETGNSVVNAIINTKKQTARQKNIKFDCNVTISRPLIMNMIYALYGAISLTMGYMRPAAAGTVIPTAADILFFIIFLHPAPSLPLSDLPPAQTPLCCSLRE